jgi:hypothetical protein
MEGKIQSQHRRYGQQAEILRKVLTASGVTDGPYAEAKEVVAGMRSRNCFGGGLRLLSRCGEPPLNAAHDALRCVRADCQRLAHQHH